MTTKDVCDECDSEETLFTCNINKKCDVELCKDCMIEHLQEEHTNEILEEQDYNFFKQFMNEKI